MSDQATKKLREPKCLELMLMRQNKIEMIYLCGCVSHCLFGWDLPQQERQLLLSISSFPNRNGMCNLRFTDHFTFLGNCPPAPPQSQH